MLALREGLDLPAWVESPLLYALRDPASAIWPATSRPSGEEGCRGALGRRLARETGGGSREESQELIAESYPCVLPLAF